MKDTIVPSRAYLHRRTGEHIDILFVGFRTENDFSDDDFRRIVEMMQSHTRWRYSGETDLLLFNLRYDKAGKAGVPDFTHVVSITLEEALREGAIGSVDQFLERLVAYAEKNTGDDPTWGFSDELALNKGANAIWLLLLHLLPEEARNAAKQLRLFAVRNVSRD